MDSAVSTAARALSVGDPLHALKLVALRNDAPALALRGIAMAQLGELAQARRLLRRAAAAFGDAEPLARARVVVAQAEVALSLRDLAGAARGLDDAATLLAKRGDVGNAAFARLVQVRRLALLGNVAEAARALGRIELSQAPARFVALAWLTAADLAMKRIDGAAAERALSRARAAALMARVPQLLAEVVAAEKQLAAPVARLSSGGTERALVLSELAGVFTATRLVIDAGRREARLGKTAISLVSRSARGGPTTRTASGCGSRSGACESCCYAWPSCAPLPTASRCWRGAARLRRCSCLPAKARPARCFRCCAPATRGRRRPFRRRWARASARCSVRFRSSRALARCARPVKAAPGAGSRRLRPELRRPCYSSRPALWGSSWA
jgi:hypothetical protein